MNYLSLILCLFFASNSLSFAQDLNGLWTGYLDQSAAASKIKGYKVYWDKGFWKKGEKTHKLQLTFEYDEKKKYFLGSYLITETVNQAHYARFDLRATFNNNQAKYTTTHKDFETQNTLNTSFCHSTATLNYSEDEGYEYLEGAWRGWNDQSKTCAAAHIRVRRKKPGYVEPEITKLSQEDSLELESLAMLEPIDTVVTMLVKEKQELPAKKDTDDVEDNSVQTRKLVTKETLRIVTKDSLVLKIWDSNRVDGDIVSLDLNGQLILESYKLTSIPKLIKIPLNKGENIVTMFAHNLGDIPPNTAALLIEREEGFKTIILKSDMGQSESVKILKN
jgi:hypothetical protein